MDRNKIIDLLKGLWGLDKQVLADSVGFKGNSYENYSYNDLLEILEIQEKMDDDLTMF